MPASQKKSIKSVKLQHFPSIGPNPSNMKLWRYFILFPLPVISPTLPAL